MLARDLSVIHLVGRFKQLSSNQVHDLLFYDRSHTPAHRCLRRLYEQKYLARIEKRNVGGYGSGQFCYQLGVRGHTLCFPETRYNPSRAVNYHSLAIADTYVILKQLERGLVLSVVGYSTEPDCWVTTGGVSLKPDMYVELELRDERLRLFMEIDMGSEPQRQIRGKLEAYWRAYNETDWDVFPRVLFVAVDEARGRELEWLISQVSTDMQRLFQVTTKDRLYSLFV